MGVVTKGMPPKDADAAWTGFIKWAYSFPEIRMRFSVATGTSLDIPRYGDEHRIVFARFKFWATCEIWGIEYAPRIFQAEVESLRVL